MRKGVKILSIALVSTTLLTGCGVNKSDYKSLRAESFLTVQEVLDSYAQELSYESITQYAKLSKEELEYNDVMGEMREKAINSYKDVIRDYKLNSDYKISKYNHEYLKAFLDDLVINEKEIVGVKEAKGYYYVEVKYTVSPNKAGTFKDWAKYLGINGAIIEDYEGNIGLDTKYLKQAIKLINEARAAEGRELLSGDYENTSNDEVETDNTNTTRNSNSVGLSIAKNADKVRKLEYDVREFNNIVGSSKEQIAFMPDIHLVFKPTTETGTVNGYGVFDSGNYGLKDFGYDRNKLTGELTLTFVFKQNELEGKKLSYQFCYVNSYKNNNLLTDYTEVMIPEFIDIELRKVVERLDRAINNIDITALMSGTIVEDAGLGMLQALYGANTQIIRLISNIDKVLARDNNVYLVEIERTVEDCAKGTGVPAVYIDRYYAIIRQKDLEFKINDMVLISRELQRTPEPDPDSATYRRLVALNLAGPISESNKVSIKATLQSLYEASTNRTLVGMYGAFNTNTELLSEERLEYLNSRLRGYLIAKGVNQPATMNGRVTAWIGGYDTQAELTTEELIEYTGTDTGLVLECYYLMSNYGTKWVIDDIEVISEREVSGEELAQIRERVNQQ